ncbi:SDR family oxidoreductase [Taibaiella soli]|uniref:NmrA family transcriptional regulator n=1 Tax=Taibaiella soli TaxID=1649169 RepID=A0A2W2AED9_9BACT|nr:SDR family oxidoreductase [Taibaiella soli]PZF71932.1 NmrA family transcriptional regulator [Taibaiella soli]
MKIVVIGGTGMIGSKLIHKLTQETAHTIVPASPQYGINTVTGEGLDEVLEGAQVIVDVSNSPSIIDKEAIAFFEKSTINISAAARRAGVKHYVALSIVGADRLPDSDYLAAKYIQEELVCHSGIPHTILRSTQFFEFTDRIAMAATTGAEVHISPAPVQPIAADETVAALAEIAINAPQNKMIEVAGPVAMPMYELIRYYLDEIEDSRQLIQDHHALYFGTELTDQSLLPGPEARLGKIKYEDWFQKQTAV